VSEEIFTPNVRCLVNVSAKKNWKDQGRYNSHVLLRVAPILKLIIFQISASGGVGI
ncbi:hypothetical protein J6590_098537, partial [Homalodisca vitripennis]